MESCKKRSRIDDEEHHRTKRVLASKYTSTTASRYVGQRESQRDETASRRAPLSGATLVDEIDADDVVRVKEEPDLEEDFVMWTKPPLKRLRTSFQKSTESDVAGFASEDQDAKSNTLFTPLVSPAVEDGSAEMSFDFERLNSPLLPPVSNGAVESSRPGSPFDKPAIHAESAVVASEPESAKPALPSTTAKDAAGLSRSFTCKVKGCSRTFPKIADLCNHDIYDHSPAKARSAKPVPEAIVQGRPTPANLRRPRPPLSHGIKGTDELLAELPRDSRQSARRTPPRRTPSTRRTPSPKSPGRRDSSLRPLGRLLVTPSIISVKSLKPSKSKHQSLPDANQSVQVKPAFSRLRDDSPGDRDYSGMLTPSASRSSLLGSHKADLGPVRPVSVAMQTDTELTLTKDSSTQTNDSFKRKLTTLPNGQFTGVGTSDVHQGAEKHSVQLKTQNSRSVGTAKLRVQILSVSSASGPAGWSSDDTSSLSDDNDCNDPTDLNGDFERPANDVPHASASGLTSDQQGLFQLGNGEASGVHSMHRGQGQPSNPSDDDRNNRNLVRKKRRQQRNDKEKPRFACPYQAYDSTKLCLKRGPHNPRGGCESLRRLKQHLQRRHVRGFRCQRCWRSFDTRDQCAQHFQQQSCEEQELDFNEVLMSDEQEVTMKSCCTRSTEEENWWKLFQTLIPGMESRSVESLRVEYSPYYSHVNMSITIPPLHISDMNFFQQPSARNDSTTLNQFDMPGLESISGSIPQSFGMLPDAAAPSEGEWGTLFQSEPILVPIVEAVPTPSLLLPTDAALSQTFISQPEVAAPAESRVESSSSLSTGTGWSSAEQPGRTDTTRLSSTPLSEQPHLQSVYNRLQVRYSRLQEEISGLRDNYRGLRDELAQVDVEVDSILTESLCSIPPDVSKKLNTISELLLKVHGRLRGI